MLLNQVVVALMIFVLLGHFFLLSHAHRVSFDSALPDAATARVSGLIIVLIVCLMSMRSIGFGFDTITYVERFAWYCAGGSTADTEFLSYLPMLTLNLGMFGLCSTTLLPGTWALLISVGLLCLPVPIRNRLRYVALLLVSMVGIELTTNAMRQGFSVVLVLFAIVWWPRRKIVASAFALVAFLMHPSAVLVLGAYGLATLPLLMFVPTFVVLTIAAVIAVVQGFHFPLVEPFLYEVRKYLLHEGSDEFWVRTLALACLVGSLVAPILSLERLSGLKGLLTSRSYTTALQLAVTSLPFLTLPYFGFRYIYGIYPIVLFLILNPPAARGNRIGTYHGVRVGTHYFLQLASGSLILLIWSFGSSYLSKVPFLADFR